MSIEEASEILSSARSVLFVTGAGISAASGIPTYRGIGGLYADKSTDDGLAIEDALSGPMFARNPALVWRYIHEIEQACRGARFNAAHASLARFEARAERVWVLTQNVDGFHRDAGSTNVIDIHGDIHQLRCTACSWSERVADYADLAPLPRCPDCRSVIRPEVVLFGEALPVDKCEVLERELERGFDVVVSIGTSSLFPYITWPVFLANARGRASIEINPQETSISSVVTVKLAMPAVDALAQIVAKLEN